MPPLCPILQPLMMTNSLKIWMGLAVIFITASPQQSLAQTMMDVTGATAIQGTLNNIKTTVPGAGSITKAKENSAAARSALNERSGTLNTTTAGSRAGITPPNSASPAPTQQASRSTTGARINGRSVPTCSHGALCHGALLQAMGGR